MAPKAKKAKKNPCEWLGLEQALRLFGEFSGATQSQAHIKPLHWYIASRLVVEGGFKPEEINPRPPFSIRKIPRHGWSLACDPKQATNSETIVLGGLKTKAVDVVVTKEGIGPVISISCKGATGAYRNLTNRMEEAAGDCTNLHITYPAMVYGYFFVARANRQTEQEIAASTRPSNDIAILRAGRVVEGLVRFHAALCELAGRRGIRDEVSRYEAAAFALVESGRPARGRIFDGFPPADSQLRVEDFFEKIYSRYNERFVYGAPSLARVTRRLQWTPDSTAFSEIQMREIDYQPRFWSPEDESLPEDPDDG